jgi:hypothetical protein
MYLAAPSYIDHGIKIFWIALVVVAGICLLKLLNDCRRREKFNIVFQSFIDLFLLLLFVLSVAMFLYCVFLHIFLAENLHISIIIMIYLILLISCVCGFVLSYYNHLCFTPRNKNISLITFLPFLISIILVLLIITDLMKLKNNKIFIANEISIVFVILGLLPIFVFSKPVKKVYSSFLEKELSRLKKMQDFEDSDLNNRSNNCLSSGKKCNVYNVLCEKFSKQKKYNSCLAEYNDILTDMFTYNPYQRCEWWVSFLLAIIGIIFKIATS